MSAQFVDVQAQVEQDGNDFLRVEADADAQLVDGTFPAVEQQPEGLLLPEQFIADEIEGPGPVEFGDRVLEHAPVDEVVVIEGEHVPHVVGPIFAEAGERDARDHDRVHVDVDGRRCLQGQRVGTGPFLDDPQFLVFLQGGLVAPPHDGVHGFGRETHHVVFRDFRLDPQVHDPEVAPERVVAEHVHPLPDDVGQVVDAVVVRLRLGEVDADDQVGAHLRGQVGREVVAHAAVHEDHPVRADRREQARNGHGGAHGGVDVAAVPDLGAAGDQVGRHADIGDRQLEEIERIGIAGRDAGEEAVDVLALDEAGGQASEDVLPDHVGGPVLAGGEVEVGLLVMVAHGLEVPLAVEERDGQGVGFPVAVAFVRDVFPVDPVAQGDIPVDAPYERIQVFPVVAEGIHPADEAADARPEDKVHRDAERLDVPDGTDMRGAFRTAAAEDQGDGRPVRADRIHPGIDFPHGFGVGGVEPESGRPAVLRRQGPGGERQPCDEAYPFTVHDVPACVVRRACRRRPGCPRPGTPGSWR